MWTPEFVKLAQNYSAPKKDLPTHLKDDPVHYWRADKGIELIHQEPSTEELMRIYSNWKLMTKSQKKLSDIKSIEIFGKDNESHFHELIKGAELNQDITLTDFQADAVKNLVDNDGRALFAHATGSGKTLTSIAGFEELRRQGKAKRAIVVVPASLRSNYVKNIKQFTNSTYGVYGPKSVERR